MYVLRIGAILKTLYGWMCALWLLVLNLIAGYESAIVAVVVCVILDTVWGIAAQIKQGRFVLSELGRKGMLSKCALYASVIIAFILIENLAGLESHVTVILVCSLICLVEVWSMSGSALIINPQMPFLRLFRSVLTDEIAHKMNKTTAEVEELFKNTDKNKKK